jgi:hypothetical protein
MLKAVGALSPFAPLSPLRLVPLRLAGAASAWGSVEAAFVVFRRLSYLPTPLFFIVQPGRTDEVKEATLYY